jgi:hypothetical protein
LLHRKFRIAQKTAGVTEKARLRFTQLTTAIVAPSALPFLTLSVDEIEFDERQAVKAEAGFYQNFHPPFSHIAFAFQHIQTNIQCLAQDTGSRAPLFFGNAVQPRLLFWFG